ncbi:hypothetical protein [Microvirga solisilvae]|uniref:hypothetical protein n=1 Tax=Microvirga solisilvae TaxID=2919498 RepID=UPI001FAF2A3E|nr:hypothetical protein [Microvirga solisilvae]
MRHVVLAAILVGLSAPAAFAQEAQSGQGMRLTVRPSGYDAQNEAQARQEKLLKRLEQSNHMIRSICVNCGDAWKHQIYEPFNPYASLKPSARPIE